MAQPCRCITCKGFMHAMQPPPDIDTSATQTAGNHQILTQYAQIRSERSLSSMEQIRQSYKGFGNLERETLRRSIHFVVLEHIVPLEMTKVRRVSGCLETLLRPVKTVLVFSL